MIDGVSSPFFFFFKEKIFPYPVDYVQNLYLSTISASWEIIKISIKVAAHDKFGQQVKTQL